MGIEPTASAWKAEVLPLYDTCMVDPADPDTADLLGVNELLSLLS